MENWPRSIEEEINISYKSIKSNEVEWPFLKPYWLFDNM